MKSRTKEIAEKLVPEGMVAIPKVGHQFAGWTVSDSSAITARDPRWFIDCAAWIRPRVLKKFIKKHHEIVSRKEYTRRRMVITYSAMAPSPGRDEILKRYA